MGLDIKTELVEEYVRVTICGEYHPQSVERVIGLVRKEADQANVHCVLLDLSGVTGGFANWEKYKAGVAASECWGYELRVAVVYCTGEIDHFFENVAVNRGAQVRVVDCQQEGIDWLNEPSLQLKPERQRLFSGDDGSTAR